MAKEKPKRYSIVIKDKVETRGIDDVDNIKERIKKYNSDVKKPYFLGNLHFDYRKHIVTFVRYKKLSNPSTLEEIDKSSINFNEHEFKTLYGVDPRNPRELSILYRSNNDIKLLPVIYKKNSEYLDRRLLEEKFYDLARDGKFLTLLLNNKQIEYSSRDSIDDFDNLYVLREELDYKDPEYLDTYYMKKFYNSFIYEGGKFNYFTFRLLANLVINYNKLLEKENTKEEPKIEKEVFGQMMLEDFLMQDLKDKYEEAKILIGEGSLDEVYKLKLIPGKNN